MGPNQEAPIDPFAPSDADPLHRLGDLDLPRAVADGLAAVFRNLLSVIGATFVAFVAYILSCCTLVGWIVVFPMLVWGLYRYLLDLVDGQAPLSALWSGFDDFRTAFLRMWGLGFLYFVVGIPIALVAVCVALLSGAGKPLGVDLGMELDLVTTSLISLAATTVYSLFLVRFVFAPYLVVERRMGPIVAFRTAWEASGPVWGKLMALQLLFVLLNLPAQALSVGSQMLGRKIQDNPAIAVESFGTMMGMTFGVYVLLAIAGVIGVAIFTAAYRQVMGKP